MRMRPEELNLIQPTIGWEGELEFVVFVLIRDNQITSQAGDQILHIFSPTKKGVSCDQDESYIDDFYLAELKEIAHEKSLQLDQITSSNIFEFVTSPAANTADLDTQFAEVTQIEVDLIRYLLEQKKAGLTRLVSVKKWIDNYNLRFPDNSLPSLPDTNEMFIVLNECISRIKYALPHLDLDNWTDSVQLAKIIQQQLKHYVQFNFVAHFGKKMGSMLNKIVEANDSRIYLKQDIIRFSKTLLNLEKKDPSDIVEINKLKDKIAYFEYSITRIEKQKNILLQSEINAARACHFIRSKYSSSQGSKIGEKKSIENETHPKLIKLEGFFFILSMRILTET